MHRKCRRDNGGVITATNASNSSKEEDINEDKPLLEQQEQHRSDQPHSSSYGSIN